MIKNIYRLLVFLVDYFFEIRYNTSTRLEKGVNLARGKRVPNKTRR